MPDTSQVYISTTVREVPTSPPAVWRYRLEIVLADASPLSSPTVNSFDGFEGFILNDEEMKGEFDGSVVIGRGDWPTLAVNLRWDWLPSNLRSGLTTESNVSATIDGSTVTLTSFWTLYSDLGDGDLDAADFPIYFAGVHPLEDLSHYDLTADGITIKVTLASALRVALQNVELAAVAQTLWDKTDAGTTTVAPIDTNEVYQFLVDYGSWRFAYVQDDPSTEVRMVSLYDWMEELAIHCDAMIAAMARRTWTFTLSDGDPADSDELWANHRVGYQSDYGPTQHRGTALGALQSVLFVGWRKDRSDPADSYSSWWGGRLSATDKTAWPARFRNALAWYEWFVEWLPGRARPTYTLDTGTGDVATALEILPIGEYADPVTVDWSQIAEKTISIDHGGADLQTATVELAGFTDPDIERVEFQWNQTNRKGEGFVVPGELHCLPSIMADSVGSGRYIDPAATLVGGGAGTDYFKWGGYVIDEHALYYAQSALTGVTSGTIVHRIHDFKVYRTALGGDLTSAALEIFLSGAGYPGASAPGTLTAWVDNFLVPMEEAILQAQEDFNNDAGKVARQIIALYGRRPATYVADGTTLGTSVVEFTVPPTLVTPNDHGRAINITYTGGGPTGLDATLSAWNVAGTASGELDVRGFIVSAVQDEQQRVKVKAVILDPTLLG